MLDPKKITARREQLTLSQVEAAARSQMTRQAWNAYESGRKSNPRLSTLLAICRALQCRVEDLIR